MHVIDRIFTDSVVIVYTVIDIPEMLYRDKTPALFSILFTYCTAFGLLAIEVASVFIGRGYGDQSRLGGAALALSIHVCL